jgi:hypothetical protein
MTHDDTTLLATTLARLAHEHDGDTLTTALDQFGWIDALHSHPQVAVPAFFEAQGYNGRWSPALHDVMTVGISELDSTTAFDNAAVVLPAPGRPAAAGAFHGSRVELDGVLLGARTASWLVAAVADPGGATHVVRVPSDAALLERQAGLDPALDIARVRGSHDDAVVMAEGPAATRWWTCSVALGRRAISHQLCGVMTAMLELARGHAMERRQFGRPVAAFQAVRHRLAEAHVALSGAEATADAVWESNDDPLASMIGKLVCGRAALAVSAHSQQVLAGIGFTAEHPFHRFMKRAVVLDRLLGSADELAVLAGGDLMARGRAPRLVEL